MELAALDWAIIVTFLLMSLGIGMYFKGRAGKSLTDFFLGGRSLPWYIAGISMVATTFAADTPLAVSEMVGDQGISKNWLWWSFLSGGMLTTFFFAKLWRRANVLTELEFIQLRYSGPEAKWLRGCKALYLGVFMNCIIIGWVNVALNTLLITFFDISEDTVIWYTLAAMTIAVIYSSLSGLLGVAITDTVQFVIAMVGCIILAVLVVSSEQVGGITGLKEKLPEGYLNFFPEVGNGGGTSWNTLTLSMGAFLSFMAVQWWASWYPGAEPGGGGYVAQRMMSTKTEKDSFFATLFFQFGHYCLRPWPWILVALSAVVLYDPSIAINEPAVEQAISIALEKQQKIEEFYANSPELRSRAEMDADFGMSVAYAFNKKLGYVYAMKHFLPTGLKGLLLVAFLAAYLSTISTQLNWGASYLVNDFYLLLRKDKGEKTEEELQRRYVLIGRLATFGVMLLSILPTMMINSISGTWELIMECGAGLGLVLILRWYWWRINAWSEIAATLAPFLGFAISKLWLEDAFGEPFLVNKGTFLFTVGFTTVVWLVVTLLTKPTEATVLHRFYERVKPAGSWKPVLAQAGLVAGKSNTGPLLAAWVTSVIVLYSLLIATGKLILQEWHDLAIFSSVFLVGAVVLAVLIKRFKIF